MTKGVIFDVDGTLIDSVDQHAQAWVQAFAHFGVDTAFEAVRGQIGKGGDQLMPVFLSPEQLERDGEAIDRFRHDLFKERYRPTLRAFPRVPELFRAIRADGRRIVLASSAKEDELEAYVRIAGIGDLIDGATSSADAERSKPHPDIFRAALDRLGLDPADAVVVGDTPYDGIAAARCNLAMIGLLCGGFPEEDLRAASAAEIYADPEALWGGYAGSLLARDRDDAARRRRA